MIGTARLWVAAGRAHGLRRLGRVRRAAAPARDRRDGDELEIDLRSLDTVARWVAGYGPDVVVLHPPELAAAVRRAWAAVAADPDAGATAIREPDPVAALAPAGRRSPVTGGGLAERLPRLLSLVPYLLARPGVPLADVAADFGIGERQLRRDLELLWMCGLPGYGPGRPGRPVVRRRHRHRHRGRGHAPPAAADHGGGHRAARRAAHAGRPARHGRHRRRAAGDGEDRAGRRRRGSGRRRRRGLPAGAGHHRRRARGAGGRAGAADPLLHRGPRRRHPPHRRPDAAAARRGPRLPGGVVPARGGGAAVPAGPRRRRRRARRAGRRPAGRRADGPVGAGCSRPGPSTAARCCCWSPGRGGWPSTTRWSRSWSCPPTPEPDGRHRA